MVELLIVFALAGWITKVVTTHRVEHEYAKRGEVPPRVQLQIDRFNAGERASEPARPGARGYLCELWHDCWDDMTERHRRIRAGKKSGEHPRLRDRVRQWFRWARTPLGEDPPQPIPAPAADPEPALAAPAPADFPPGTWTVGEDGQPVPLGPPVATPEPTATEPASEPPPDQNEETPVPTPTRTAPAADEVTTNEAARREFAALQAAAAEAADALSALEAARDKMAAHATALADGVSAKRFDSGATAAAADAAAAINSGTLADWAERVDTVAEQAAAGHAALDKYRDTEDLIATQNVDATTVEQIAA